MYPNPTGNHGDVFWYPIPLGIATYAHPKESVRVIVKSIQNKLHSDQDIHIGCLTQFFDSGTINLMTTENTIPVPYGLKVSISVEVRGNTKYVIVHAPLYKNKRYQLGFCYGLGFSTSDILKDHSFTTTMINKYGT